MAEFAVDHPEIHRDWRHHSNFLVVVSVPHEGELRRLRYAADALGIKHTLVEEPDYNGEATAIALEPGEMASRLCAQYPLALKKEKLVA